MYIYFFCYIYCLSFALSGTGASPRFSISCTVYSRDDNKVYLLALEATESYICHCSPQNSFKLNQIIFLLPVFRLLLCFSESHSCFLDDLFALVLSCKLFFELLYIQLSHYVVPFCFRSLNKLSSKTKNSILFCLLSTAAFVCLFFYPLRQLA